VIEDAQIEEVARQLASSDNQEVSFLESLARLKLEQIVVEQIVENDVLPTKSVLTRHLYRRARQKLAEYNNTRGPLDKAAWTKTGSLGKATERVDTIRQQAFRRYSKLQGSKEVNTAYEKLVVLMPELRQDPYAPTVGRPQLPDLDAAAAPGLSPDPSGPEITA
jgi:hypothetical protein